MGPAELRPRLSSNCKLKTRPLVREGATIITNPQLFKDNGSWVPDGGPTPGHTATLTAGCKTTLTGLVVIMI
jgi:hypothetical protein